jgi:uncharacterized membrane protein YgcG
MKVRVAVAPMRCCPFLTLFLNSPSSQPYVELGVKNGYTVTFREPTTPWARDAAELAKKNQHSVPEEGIRRMLQRWEENPTVEKVLQSKAPSGKGPRSGPGGRGGSHSGGRGGSTHVSDGNGSSAGRGQPR